MNYIHVKCSIKQTEISAVINLNTRYISIKFNKKLKAELIILNLTVINLKVHIVTDSVSRRLDCCAVKNKVFVTIPGSKLFL